MKGRTSLARSRTLAIPGKQGTRGRSGGLLGPLVRGKRLAVDGMVALMSSLLGLIRLHYDNAPRSAVAIDPADRPSGAENDKSCACFCARVRRAACDTTSDVRVQWYAL